MKTKIVFAAGFLISIMFGCQSNVNKNTPEKWSDEQATSWFNKKEWLGETNLQPDSTLNKKEFAIAYYKNKTWWDLAFNFLKNEDFSSLSVGVHELDSQNVFVKVTEYYTKDPARVLFEAHRDYADIQYVISGSEYIDLTSNEKAAKRIDYDAAKDIEFFEAEPTQRLLGKPGTFFIIPPNVIHRPSIMIDDSIMVKKIVIKVRD